VVLQTGSPARLLNIFEKSFAGVAGFLEILRAKPLLTTGALAQTWHNHIKERFPPGRVGAQRRLRTKPAIALIGCGRWAL
jgi:hypothetical protein